MHQGICARARQIDTASCHVPRSPVTQQKEFLIFTSFYCMIQIRGVNISYNDPQDDMALRNNITRWILQHAGLECQETY